MVLADFNNDGRLDLVAQARTAVSIFLGNGDGTFIQQANVGSSPGPMAAGDFNGDGKLDLAISYVPLSFGDPGSLSIYLGNGDGTFGLFPFGIGLGRLLGPPVVGQHLRTQWFASAVMLCVNASESTATDSRGSAVLIANGPIPNRTC